MNIRKKIFEIIGIQDSINHTNHHAPPIDADTTATQEYNQEAHMLRRLRYNATEGLIEYVIRLEERIKELEGRLNHD